jgi:D-3-phosphoglycerate dehydrogenase
MSAPVVFVGHDRVLDDVLDRVAEGLRRDGVDVVRGPAAPPPALTRYTPEEQQTFFGRARVAVISSRTVIDRHILRNFPQLCGIVFASSSTASCDLDDATAEGVLVANGATAENMESMAEATVMLAAALMLDLPLKQRQFAEGSPRPRPDQLTSRMLAGSTVGLIGFGRIAREVVHRLANWRVGRILAYTRSPRTTQWPNVEFVDLHTLLRESDVVSLHLPLAADTRGMLGADELALMRPGSVLINTARGGLVDESALAKALQDGHLRGAAIDTFVEEPVAPSHPLRGLPSVILTEHLVGHTRELFDSLAPAALQSVHDILNGRPPAAAQNAAVLPKWRGMR